MTAPHTEAGTLAEVLHALECDCGTTDVGSRVAEHAALSWLSARLSADDVVEAAARAIATIDGSKCFEQEFAHSASDRAWYRDEARAALRAAAAVIGGER